MSRRNATWGLVLIVLAAGVGFVWHAVRPHDAGKRIPVTAATRGEFVVSLPAEGPLESDDAVVVSTGKAPGELTMIVSDGTVVRAGEVFCRIEARDLLRRQADAKLASTQGQEEIERTRESAQERYETDQRNLEQSQKDFEIWQESVGVRTKQGEDQLAFDHAEAERLRQEYERSQRMAAKGYIAASEADIAKAAYDAQQFKVEQSAKDLELSRREIAAELRQRQSQLDAVKRRTGISRSRIEDQVNHARSRAEVAARELETITAALADTTITAAASGTVSLFSTFRGGERRPRREGDQVSSGTPLGSISGNRNMSIRCRIKESNIAALRKGQQAEIEFAALAGRKFTGVVSSVGAVAREVWIWEDPTAEANERVFDVLIEVNPPRAADAGGLKPGLNARARIIVKRLPNALFVPLDAVFERNGKSFAYVKRGDGFERREVQTGDRNEVAVVLRSGLAAGELVALSEPASAKMLGTGSERASGAGRRSS